MNFGKIVGVTYLMIGLTKSINILQENATEDTKRKKALTTVTNPNDLKGAVAHPISYDPNKQWTHTLYKKKEIRKHT